MVGLVCVFRGVIMKNLTKILILSFIASASIQANGLTQSYVETASRSIQKNIQSFNGEDRKKSELVPEAIKFYKKTLNETFSSIMRFLSSIDQKLVKSFFQCFKEMRQHPSLKFNPIKAPILLLQESLKGAVLYSGYDMSSVSAKKNLEWNKILIRLVSLQAKIYEIIFNEQHEYTIEIINLAETILAQIINIESKSDVILSQETELQKLLTDLEKSLSKLYDLYGDFYMRTSMCDLDQNSLLNSLFKPHSDEIINNILSTEA